MIARLRGEVVAKSPTELVIDCQGVGYAVHVSVGTAERATAGSTICVHTYLAVREDALQLFGFETMEERSMFLHLISISGIGGKTAMAALSSASIEDIRSAVVHKNTTFLQKLPGVGKKTAERIIVELQDKLRSDYPVVPAGGTHQPALNAVQADTVSAMVALGYNRQHAEKAVRSVLGSDSQKQWTTDTLLRSALQFMQ